MRFPSLRRATSLFAQGQVADSVYFIEDGLVKLTRTSPRNGRIILNVCGPEYLIGEEAATENSASTYYADAEILTPASVLRIPRDVILRSVNENPQLGIALISAITEQKRALAEKVELLCLHDVEYRILHYLAELSGLLKPVSDSDGYQLPITQLELADLIGATRETTSTTLNQLERRGLIRLSRRLLTIPSPSTLRNAAASRNGGATTPSTTSSASNVV
jgi:CRP/FNR family transcriptional regulator